LSWEIASAWRPDRRVICGSLEAGAPIAVVERILRGRPDRAFSLGVQQDYLSSKMRASMIGGGIDASTADTGFEVACSDRLNDRITLQPDVQIILDPGGQSGGDPIIDLG
jgi:porin